MKVKQLIAFLEGADPDAVVLVPAPDHSYRVPTVSRDDTALYDRDSRTWSEDAGEEYTPEGDEFGKRYPAVIFR